MRRKIIFPALLIILVTLTSCWNYREVNEMAILMGAALDKGITNNYLLTVELLDVSGGQQAQVTTKFVSIEGETVFDAARKLISIQGKRGYWGHIRVLIISEEIASEDINEVIRFFRQDAETRGDLYIIISKGCSAKRIFNADIALGNVLSESLAKSLDDSKYLSEIPRTKLYTLTQNSKSNKISPALPAVTLMESDDITLPILSGTAVFQQNKLVGYLNEDETKSMLFLKNEIEGGVLVTKTDTARISLEIINNNTKVKPKVEGDQFIVDITVETKAAIDEVTGDIEYSNLAILDEIERLSEEQLKNKLEDVIDKARHFQADIFGFGEKLYENDPEKWYKISDDYEKAFTNMKANVSVKVDVVNTSIIYKQ